MIEKISLSNFRNFEKQTFQFSSDTTSIIGANGAGKTNILEAIFLLATGKSFKARINEEMINYDHDIARVKGKIGDTDLEALITKGVIERGGVEEHAPKKRLMVNGVARRIIDFSGILKVTLFRPSEMDLITSSPSVRREFMDTVLSQVDREYRRSLMSYEKGVRRRNKILQRIRDEGFSRAHLEFWDRLLIKNGDYISQKREDLIDFINSTKQLNDKFYEVNYDKSAISEHRLKQYEREEVYAGTTLVGPHRDDLIINLENRDLSKYGSRGESRMGVVWMKLAESQFIEKISGELPTLLLDDVFSELDHEHRKIVIEFSAAQQTIITSADPHYVEGLKADKISL